MGGNLLPALGSFGHRGLRRGVKLSRGDILAMLWRCRARSEVFGVENTFGIDSPNGETVRSRADTQHLRPWIFLDARSGERKGAERLAMMGTRSSRQRKSPVGLMLGHRDKGVLANESSGARYLSVADITASVRPEVAGVKAGSLRRFANGMEKSEEAPHCVRCDGA